MNTVRLGWTLVHFLWQGMLIAAIYAAIRRSLTGANGRYLLACAALFAMTVAPVVTWFAIGQSDTPPAVAMDQTARVSAKIVTLPAAVESGVPVAPATPWLQWAVMIWLAGASTLSVRLLGGWLMAARLRWTATRPAPLEWVQTIERLGRQLRIPGTVGLRVSAIVPSPVVIGALRPLVLVPVGMLAGLPAAQVEALLVHELAHIRRHDYLVNLLQSIAEAMLFYHPAVWWVSGHIRTEREHCCDDAAVAVSGDLMGYVSALAELAGSRSLELTAVAANGGSLAGRITRLLGETRPAPPRKRGTLLAAVLLAAATYGVYAQDAPRPSFAAASVKLNTENAQMRMLRPQVGGRLTTKNATLQMMIVMRLTNVQRYQVIGRPGLDGTPMGTISRPSRRAKPIRPQLLLMLQSLLADRFRLAMHRETRELPVYHLVAAKGSFNPPPPDPGCTQPDPAILLRPRAPFAGPSEVGCPATSTVSAAK